MSLTREIAFELHPESRRFEWDRTQSELTVAQLEGLTMDGTTELLEHFIDDLAEVAKNVLGDAAATGLRRTGWDGCDR